MCDFYADRKNSKFFNRIVHRHLWVQVHGLQQKILNRQKPEIFALVRAKALTVFTSGGQRSRSNVHLAGHCLAVP